jgi:hypothetical protein
MAAARLIQEYRDASYRPIIRTIADALNKLHELGYPVESSRSQIRAPSEAGKPALFAGLSFRNGEEDETIIAFPSSKGCWAKTTRGVQIYLTLEKLDGAEVDGDGNVSLPDGTSVHAVRFDTLTLPFELTEVEHAIIFLTVCFLKEERTCFYYAPEVGYVGVDFSKLHALQIKNVKGLGRFINARIQSLRREEGKPAFQPVALAAVQRTLDIAGIQKARGRKPRSLV